MSELAPHNRNLEDFLQPEVSEVTISENKKLRIINIGGKFMKLGYDIENKKRLRQGLPPALMKIVHQETLIENGKTIKIIEVL
jgi:hypothetical protein